MSKKLSSEEALRQKINELPLPDENESWQKMKELLDEKEKRKPFVFFRNDKAWSGAMLLLLLCMWLVISPEKINKQTSVADVKYKASEKQNPQQNKIKETITDKDFSKNKTIAQQDNSANISSLAQIKNNKKIDLSQRDILFNKNKQPNDGLRKKSGLNKYKSFTAKPDKNDSVKTSNVRKVNSDKQFDNNITVLQRFSKKQQDKIISNDSLEMLTVIDNNSKSPALVKADSSNQIIITTDSLRQQTSNAATANIIVKQHNPYFIDAGIGLAQQVPISGQKFIADNYNGNKAILADYIPSVYIKLEKEKQWFLQSEFNYASPRLINAFTYYQKTRADYNHANTASTVYHLQKTWYNEVPASFNLYIRPTWSVGAGIMYSWLRGAVANKETVINDVQSGKTTTATQLLPIKGFTDSFLYKTQTGFLLQTGYEKNKWSFGLRYIHDIQPFLTYTLPDGTIKDKRNTSLQLLIRYRLFQSAKFRLGKL